MIHNLLGDLFDSDWSDALFRSFLHYLWSGM